MSVDYSKKRSEMSVEFAEKKKSEMSVENMLNEFRQKRFKDIYI